jgi:hypothetical protein
MRVQNKGDLYMRREVSLASTGHYEALRKLRVEVSVSFLNLQLACLKKVTEQNAHKGIQDRFAQIAQDIQTMESVFEDLLRLDRELDKKLRDPRASRDAPKPPHKRGPSKNLSAEPSEDECLSRSRERFDRGSGLPDTASLQASVHRPRPKRRAS